jgi:hypothetical protein
MIDQCLIVAATMLSSHDTIVAHSMVLKLAEAVMAAQRPAH